MLRALRDSVVKSSLLVSLLNFKVIRDAKKYFQRRHYYVSRVRALRTWASACTLFSVTSYVIMLLHVTSSFVSSECVNCIVISFAPVRIVANLSRKRAEALRTFFI